MKISKRSTAAFKAAAKKLNISPELPGVSMLREDLAVWLTASYMLAVIIEAEKNGETHDITNHEVVKYEPIHKAAEGYEAGSSGGGFSFRVFDFDFGYSNVGARLSSNSSAACRENAKKYRDLWEIFTLNVK